MHPPGLTRIDGHRELHLCSDGRVLLLHGRLEVWRRVMQVWAHLPPTHTLLSMMPKHIPMSPHLLSRSIQLQELNRQRRQPKIDVFGMRKDRLVAQGADGRPKHDEVLILKAFRGHEIIKKAEHLIVKVRAARGVVDSAGWVLRALHHRASPGRHARKVRGDACGLKRR